MIITRNKFNVISVILLTILLSLCLCFYTGINTDFVYAQNMASQEITLTNSDFNSSTTSSLQSTPNGWSRVGSSSGTNGVISVNSETFSSRASSYSLTSSQNPSKPYTQPNAGLDDHILMINAKNSATQIDAQNHLGYESNDITLDEYSYYRFSIWTLTQTNARASIYIEGLDDDTANTKFEAYTTNGWTEYRFYIATGIEEQTISLQLWLGTKTSDSTNAVFFDHITITQLSGNYFYQEAGQYVGSDSVVLNRTNVIDLRDTLGVIDNANFETGNFSGWTVENYLPIGGNAKIVSIQNQASMESLGLKYLGSSLSEQNNYALVLYSTSDQPVTIQYKSSSFDVLPYETYKITIWAKVSDDFDGNAYVTLKEGTDVSNFYGEQYSESFYTPVEQSVTISSNTTNVLTNNYTPYSIYVKGHDLYKTSFSLVLSLGNNEEGATGSIVFDDITFEAISWSQFDDASSTNSISVSPSILTGSPTVENGNFNEADTLDKNFEYPVTPASWTSETENATSSMYGIINTHSPLYETHRQEYGNARNPGNPSTVSNLGVDKDVNNVLMLYNYQETYQSITSSDITTTANSYQTISFDYKTVTQDANNSLLSVYIVDGDGNTLFADTGLSSNDWTNYTLMINTDTYTSTLRLRLALGTEENPVVGYLYVDNVRFDTNSTMTDDQYEVYAQTHKTLDFSLTNFNFVSSDSLYGIHTPYMYEQNLEQGSNPSQGDLVAYGGMIDSENNIYGISNSTDDPEQTYMPAFISNSISRYTLTGKESLSLQANTYYKVSVNVLTRFTGNTEQAGVSDEEKLAFGAIFGLVGMDKNFEEIVSNDEWTTYTIYVTVSSTTSVQLQFGILNESAEIQGQAFFDNLMFETIEETEYNDALERFADDKSVLLLTAEDATSDDDNDDIENDDETGNEGLLWYLIPTAILFVALVIALCAYFMKKVTIKKWERKKASEYDREATLYRDVVRREAEQIRDNKIKEYENKINEIKQQLEKIEQIHQENLKQQRTTLGQQQITKSSERDFKAYASRHTKLENQIEALNAKIESFKLPEYLLSVQRSIILEKVKKEKLEKEKRIKEEKAKKKADKQKNKG